MRVKLDFRFGAKAPVRALWRRAVGLRWLSLVGAVVSCSHSIHQMYVGSMDPGVTYGQGRWVTAEVKDEVVLSFEMDSRYIERGREALEEKCKGRLAQVTVEHLTSFKFLSYDQRLILRGLCLS